MQQHKNAITQDDVLRLQYEVLKDQKSFYNEGRAFFSMGMQYMQYMSGGGGQEIIEETPADGNYENEIDENDYETYLKDIKKDIKKFE
jgi:hypothetical protein